MMHFMDVQICCNSFYNQEEHKWEQIVLEIALICQQYHMVINFINKKIVNKKSIRFVKSNKKSVTFAHNYVGNKILFPK